MHKRSDLYISGDPLELALAIRVSSPSVPATPYSWTWLLCRQYQNDEPEALFISYIKARLN